MGDLPKPAHSHGKVQRWTGRQILSTIIPKKINVDMKTGQYNETKDFAYNRNHIISIKNGEIHSGTFDKDVYQARTKGLVHSIYNEYGPEETRIFLDNTQKLICNWLVLNGFSVGISDMVVSTDSLTEFHNIIHKMKTDVYDVIRKVHLGQYENKSTKSTAMEFEREVNNLLNEAVNRVGVKGAQQVDENVNRLINMIKSKSKGSTVNVSQMIGCLGQQNVDGRRIPYGFDYRTLPHYSKYDDGPESRGFVESSFIQGLTPQEFFFHAMGGREGLIDTAVQSVTGDTPIIVLEDGKSKYVKIGDWIDGHLAEAAANNEEIRVFPDQHNMEFYKFPENKKMYIPTGTNNGETSWGEMTAITRHDIGGDLFEVKTYAGRVVKVVDSKSLLVWDGSENTFKVKNTSDVRVGDFVPAITNMPEPPVISKYFDMTEYFPKTKYIYGTDFNLALKMMRDAINDRIQIPRGWWQTHNGKEFTLPYPDKAKLQRASVRSNTENIHDGCFYPYSASRDTCRISDKFQLNLDNGRFIGIYLADGVTCEKSGNVIISNMDKDVQKFVGKWFDKFSIKHDVRARDIEYRGHTESIIGNSTLLARFLDKFVGHGARNKYIPDIAFSAPKEFIIGLLGGYFSGDASISGNTEIVATSVSYKLIEGIAALCARIGVFGRICSHQKEKNNLGTKDIARTWKYIINAHWSRIFASRVRLIKPSKQKQLTRILEKNLQQSHPRFDELNDVVLDEIVSITKLDKSQYTKVYDVTVPSTLNFAMASGHLGHDTSETGYIQRKLVKAMEDCKVSYDGSVRNAAGSIIQFLYGDDGMDATKIESQVIPYVDYDHDEFIARYTLNKNNYEKDLPELMTEEAYKEMKKTMPTLEKRMKAHIDQITVDREFLILKLFKGKVENTVMYPVSFFRIINIAKGTVKNLVGNVKSDLTPQYILDSIEELCDQLFVNKHHRGTKLFNILVRAYLSPKIVIMTHGLNRLAFDYVVNQIRGRFMESLAHPSEMVGVISAQSIGEPATQLVLNSVHYDTNLLLRIDGEVKKVKIGEYIDGSIQAAKQVDIENHPNDTTLAWLKDSYVEVPSCDKAGQISWKQVEAVTKHPVVNEDGSNTLIKVHLRSGRSIIATKAKSFLQRIDNEIVPVEGKDLKVGDRLPVSMVLPVREEDELHYFDLAKYLNKREFVFMSSSKRGNKHDIDEYAKDCIYPKQRSSIEACIPEKIPMDKDFGFFVGAYLAEGHATFQHIYIANNDEVYREHVRTFFDKYKVGWHVTSDEKNGGISTSIHGHSSILATLFRTHFGELAHLKKFPAELLFGNKTFLKALINGYFSGDGTIAKDIRADSTSRELLDGIQQILLRFNINSNIVLVSKSKQQFKNAVQQPYQLQITGSNILEFARRFKLVVADKQSQLDRFESYKTWYTNTGYDMIPNVKLSTGVVDIHRDDVKTYIVKSTNATDKAVLENIYKEQVLYDEIIKIEEISNDHSHVYDLTVQDTKTFNDFTGLCQNDTFHSAGISSASQTVRGVPRLKELLGVSKKMKTPSMKIYFKEQYCHDQNECLKLMNTIRTVRFKDIITTSQIFFDPKNILYSENKFMDIYKGFGDCDDDIAMTPWVLRLEINREALLQYQITMIQLHQKLIEWYKDLIKCYFADDNTNGELVFRIRMRMGDNNADDMLTELKALEHNIMENIAIQGTEGIERVSLVKQEKKMAKNKLISTYDPTTQKFANEEEWLVVSDGTNLADILINPKVNAAKTVTNNIVEIYETLGIEAVRQALFNEISEVLDTIHVDYRHIAMLVDVQTNKGYVLSIDRHGINRGDIGPLAKCSFEETTDKLIKAGVFAEYDKINGVSANVMLGQIPPAGTGDCEVLMDHEMITKSIAYVPEHEDEEMEDVCMPEQFKITYTPPVVDLTKPTMPRIKNL